TGHGERSLEVLRARGLFAELMPTVDSYLARHPDGAVARLLKQGLVNTDQRVQQGKPVTPTFLFALLLYGPIADIIEKQPQEKWHDIGTIVDAVDRAARAAHAGAAAFSRRLRPAAAARRHGTGRSRDRLVVDESPGSVADGSRSHGRRARRARAPGGRGRRSAPASPAPSPRAGPRTRGHMNAALAGMATLPAWQPAYVGLGSNLDGPR